MILSDISSLKAVNYIQVKCDECSAIFSRTLKNTRANRKRNNGRDLCFKCAYKKSATGREQNTKEYWAQEHIKIKHGEILKSSKKFVDAHKKMDRFGINNGMYGKKASSDTREKMSKSRIGKKQSQETIDKRRKTFLLKREEKLKNGEFNLNKALKYFINSELKWTGRIIQRDDKKCRKCGSSEKLDAHHIKSFNSIINELLEKNKFETTYEKYLFLRDQKEIKDPDLENGICLCRKCHREEHGKKWGSHNI